MTQYALLLAGILLLLTGCKPDDTEPDPIGGKGGSATLGVIPRHHARVIDSCMVYIKYNAVDTPANGRYDDSARVVKGTGESRATFSGLKKGKYYVYGYGWDAGMARPGPVKGGFAYRISSENAQTLDLAVSEGH
jgi:hypothetical protein